MIAARSSAPRPALSAADAEILRLRRQVAALEEALDEAHLRIEELLQPGEDLAEMLARFPELKLTARQAALVAVIWRKRGQVLRFSLLAAAVAGGTEPNQILLRTQLAYLRRKIARAGLPWRIEAIRGAGYRLIVGDEGEASPC
jgi:DNA-binding response OmpR family regulator